MAPLLCLAHAASVTSRIRLATGLLIAPYYHPVPLAREIQTLHHLSNGRFVLGVGPGWDQKEFETLGMKLGERGRRTDEIIAALRRLLTERDVSFEGRYYRFQHVSIDPLPGLPELWVGGGSKIKTALSPDKTYIAPTVLARIAGADGWLARAAGSQQMVKDDVQAIRAYLAAHGRDPSSLRYGHLNFTHLVDTDDREKALMLQRPHIERVMGTHRSFENPQESYFLGTTRKIAELGRLDGPAKRTIEADGRVVAPGFVDNHCHYDAQVLWDPLCTFSCHHGATTVIIGNCSLALAPVKTQEREKLAGMLSYVEAIPMDVLQAGVPWNWESFPEYMKAIGQRLGVNVGTLVGHSAVRLYAMGEECSDREATTDELETMRRLVREALEAGALGLSITRNMNHFDIVGKRIPAACAPESELFALADVLREVGTGVIQCGGGTNPELKDKLLSRIAQACGRPIMYNTLLEQARQPGRWRTHLQHVEETARQGIRAIPLCNPGSIVNRFTM